MNELLEQHFDTAFAAPDGIAKLRELILTLAMQGKLVEQDANDPPASELLKEIEKERASHEGTKTRRKGKALPPIKPEEVPYELPQGWEWVRLGNITEYNGRNNISGDEIAPDTWLLDLEDIEKGKRIDYELRFIEPFESTSPAYMVFTELDSNRTSVQWGFEGETPYPMNLMLLFVNVEDELGKELQAGLNNLKAIFEK